MSIKRIFYDFIIRFDQFISFMNKYIIYNFNEFVKFCLDWFKRMKSKLYQLNAIIKLRTALANKSIIGMEVLPADKFDYIAKLGVPTVVCFRKAI